MPHNLASYLSSWLKKAWCMTTDSEISVDLEIFSVKYFRRLSWRRKLKSLWYVYYCISSTNTDIGRHNKTIALTAAYLQLLLQQFWPVAATLVHSSLSKLTWGNIFDNVWWPISCLISPLQEKGERGGVLWRKATEFRCVACAECQIILVKKWYSATSANIGTTSTCVCLLWWLRGSGFVHFAVHVLSSTNYYCSIVLGE